MPLLDLEPELDVFLEDFGDPVTSGQVNGLGIFNAPGKYELADGAILIDASVLVRADLFGSLRYQEQILVQSGPGAGSYEIKEAIPQGDGAFLLLTLKPFIASTGTWFTTLDGVGLVTLDNQALVVNGADLVTRHNAAVLAN